MKILLTILVIFVYGVAQIHGQYVTCYVPNTPCFLQRRTCPSQCPDILPSNPKEKSKVCYLNCNSPICRPECRSKHLFSLLTPHLHFVFFVMTLVLWKRCCMCLGVVIIGATRLHIMVVRPTSPG